MRRRRITRLKRRGLSFLLDIQWDVLEALAAAAVGVGEGDIEADAEDAEATAEPEPEDARVAMAGPGKTYLAPVSKTLK